MQAEIDALIETFSADEYIINIIRRAMTNAQDIMIESKSHGYIIILAKEAEYFAKVDNLPEFCNMSAKSLKITVLNEKKLNEYKTGIGRNIDELLWQAGYYASNGRLLEGCFWNDVIKLNYWPNFTRLPMTPNSLRIAALLAVHPVTIEHTILVLKVKREEVYQFYCASLCAGAVSTIKGNGDAPIPSLKPHRRNALLGLLLSKIASI
ncbi:hypothetical protein MNBD_GAMMA07-2749 [hydrothermal vent metagenome]|uniref:Uncharacterized protein n=1 Tax=hydrothermal vent metagenome TaxID=652676 RepID=A0A3B0WKL0_9ZZZZ